MPFIHRQVSPVYLAKLKKDDSQEITCLTDTQIRILNGIIEQLSDMSNLATGIVENIKDDCDKINERTGKIFERVSKVRQQVEEMKTGEKVCNVLEDQVREQQDMDGQLFTPENRPKKIQELYMKADPIPNMDILQPYRDDELKCGHFYSHPGFFFELWKAQFVEAARKEKEKRREERKRRKKGKKKEPKRKVVVYTKLKTTAQRHIEEAIAKGIYVPKEGNLSPVAEDPEKITDLPLPTEMSHDLPLPPPDLLPPVSSPFPDPPQAPLDICAPEAPLTLPPAPKAPVAPQAPQAPEAPRAPPAPEPPQGPMPPPPPPPSQGPGVPASSRDMASQLAAAKLKTVVREETPSCVDTRSDLLAQIRDGKKNKLKKVETKRQSLMMAPQKEGIGGIFERALADIADAKCYSDDEDDDSDGWSEEEW